MENNYPLILLKTFTQFCFADERRIALYAPIKEKVTISSLLIITCVSTHKQFEYGHKHYYLKIVHIGILPQLYQANFTKQVTYCVHAWPALIFSIILIKLIKLILGEKNGRD